MQTLNNSSIERVNQLWKLHQNRNSKRTGPFECLAFFVDDRYLSWHEGLESRLGLSFGHNPYAPETGPHFLGPPILPDTHAFALHNIASRENELTIFDSWIDAYPGDAFTDPAVVVEQARQLLDAISDETYQRLCNLDSAEDVGPVLRRSLEAVTIVEGEAF